MSILQDNIKSVTDMIAGCSQAIETAQNQIKEVKIATKNLDKIKEMLESSQILTAMVNIRQDLVEGYTTQITISEETITSNKAQMKKLQKALATLQEIAEQ